MVLYLASENKDKKKEIEAYFPQWEIVTPKEKNLTFNPVENGTSFLENALIKAKTLWDIVKHPVLADDSGLCVRTLNCRPGIHSARYKGASQEEKNRNLIDELNQHIREHNLARSQESRQCFFVCSLVYYYGENRYFSVQETLEGILLEHIDLQRGTNGFGYDPIVYLPKYNKTVAELSKFEKNNISHRGKALSHLKTLLE